MELLDKNGLTEAEFLARYRPSDYPRPSFTADVVVLSGASAAAEAFANAGACSLKVLLIRRGGHPYLGCWAFPGGFVNPDEDADAAAARELEEETGMAKLAAEQLGVYSAPGRDPRGWTVSATYLACVDEECAVQAGDDATTARWCDVRVVRHADEYEATIDAGPDTLTCRFLGCDRLRRAGRARVVQAEGLAFDHADMFADALARILE